MSSMLLAVAAAALAPAHDAASDPTPVPPVTAEQALENERALVGPLVRRPVETCPDAGG